MVSTEDVPCWGRPAISSQAGAGQFPSYSSLPIELRLQWHRSLYFRTLGAGSGAVWQEKADSRPQARWRAVQRDATGNESAGNDDGPSVFAIRFLGVANGKHNCKPTTQCNMRQI
jgi:hypothetical protein